MGVGQTDGLPARHEWAIITVYEVRNAVMYLFYLEKGFCVKAGATVTGVVVVASGSRGKLDPRSFMCPRYFTSRLTVWRV